MNPLTAIHSRWAADAALNGLLAATSVATGTFLKAPVAPALADRVLPYATINREEGGETFRSNAERIDNLPVTIAVYHDDYDKGHAIAEAVLSAFNNANFALDGNDRVIDMRCPPYAEQQDAASGVWAFVFAFSVAVHWGAA